MKSSKGFFQLKASFLGLLTIFLMVALGYLLTGFPADLIDGNGSSTPAMATGPVPDPEGGSGIPAHAPAATGPSPAADPHWIDNGGQLTENTRRLERWLDEGKPLDVRIGEGASIRYGFRPVTVTSDDFRLSKGVNSELPAQYRVYSGREILGNGGLGEQVSLAVVNGAVAMAITRDGENFLVETDPATGELVALALHGFESPHACGSAPCDAGHTRCELSPGGDLAMVSAPAGLGVHDPVRTTVAMSYPIAQPAGFANAEQPELADAVATHPYFRHGQAYNGSLRDILVLWASAKSQTGDSSQLSTRAAAYLSVAARSADAYERQLGLRYLLQELILIASDSAEEDPGNPPAGVYSVHPDLEHWRAWLTKHRPQATFKYGHGALWTVVGDGAGGVIGTAWTDSYGSATYGHSVQERNWGWEVHSHELGHNIGSSHTNGGIMNPSLVTGNEDFFTIVTNTTYTGAKDIYNYMGSSTRAFVFGTAPLRHPEEMPFGIDDVISTAAGTSVAFNPLANDKKQVTNGQLNTLSLLEVGQVYPLAAGTARAVGGLIEFNPAAGFTGQAWFSYTLAGSIGNSGSGWLHAADVIVTVGGNSTAPSQTPAMTVVADYVVSDFSSQIRVNPLLNDEAAGRLWAGNVEVVLGPRDTTPEAYSDRAFRLVSATLLTGNGTIDLDKRSMTRSSSSVLDNTGLITYTPGASEGNEVLIQYTVMDANGLTSTGLVSISRTTSIGVVGSLPSVAEDSGEVVAFTFERTGNANLSIDEVVDFTVSGSADPAGLRADYALAGHASFDPVSGFGTFIIPAGQRQAHLFAAVLNDGVKEDYETCILTITGSSSSLEISQVNGSSTLYIRDNSVIYVEPFDSFGADATTWNGWTNLKNANASGKGGEDLFDWTALSGGTATAGTGPSADHTSGSGKYLYAEASGNVTEYAYLMSPAIDVSGRSAAELEFWYHMYGSGLGSLSLDLFVNGVLAAPAVWSRSGQQSSSGTDWRSALVDVSAYLPATSIQLRFRADIGSTEISDIAIDDVHVMAVSAAAPKAPLVLVDPVGCEVETGSPVYLSVIPEAFPAPQIQWYKDGGALPGATGPSYFIPAADASSVGAYSARISNSVGSTVSLEAQVELPFVPPGGTYINWTGDEGLSPEQSGLASDPDFDGLINLFEFAFGSDPLVAGTSSLPVLDVAESAGQVYLEISYRRRAGGTVNASLEYLVDDLTYRVETAETLTGPWTSGVGVVEQIGVPVSNGDGTQTVTVRRLAPLATGPAFLRVSIDSAF